MTKTQHVLIFGLILSVFPLSGFLCDDESEPTVTSPSHDTDAAVADAASRDAASKDAASKDADSEDASEPDASLPDAASMARVFFVSPTDGAHITPTTFFTLGVEDFTLVPASTPVAAGQGHLHVLLDVACVKPGDPIASGPSDINLDSAQSHVEIALPRGAHTLCLQASTSANVALDLTDVIGVMVE